MSKGQIIAESAVKFVRDLLASPARVWEFLTDLELLPEWYGEASIEEREGGAVSLMGGHIRGVVTAWRPEKFLGYTWNVFQPGETESAWPVSYLEFSLDATDGGTRLVLMHRPIPEAMHKLTAMGWHTMLDLIQAGLNGDFPKRADLFPKNAALYGVDLGKLKKG
jgi:uncharacterized protein YndB with AHSA1/START domain